MSFIVQSSALGQLDILNSTGAQVMSNNISDPCFTLTLDVVAHVQF